MQILLNAGRYAGAVRHVIDGELVNYWEIEDLPEVRDFLVVHSGATHEQVDEYIKATSKTRETLTKEPVYGRIKESFSFISRKDELLGSKRREFFRATQATGDPKIESSEWYLAMLASGNDFLLDTGDVSHPGYVGGTGIRGHLMRKGHYRHITTLPYEEMYMNLMVAR